jgi:hypothetical protein
MEINIGFSFAWLSSFVLSLWVWLLKICLQHFNQADEFAAH